jgi:peptide/nickel transport system permease protein
MGASVEVPAPPSRVRQRAQAHPILRLTTQRVVLGIVTLIAASILVFAATQVLPGNAAQAILGKDAAGPRLHALEQQLHLDRSIWEQYWAWFSGLLTGHTGTSFATGSSVWSVAGPRLANSAVLVALAGLIGTFIAGTLGILAALRRGGWLDRCCSTVSLALTALPEFVIAIALILLFSTLVLRWLPGVSLPPAGQHPWDRPTLLVLPVATLVLSITPYIFRMTRAALIEALASDYVQTAELKGLATRRVVLVHALPNAVPPTIQVIGLTFLYLAGGTVVVEYVFAYPGIGQGLVNAVSDRDVPIIQFTVVVLAAFYVAINIITDVVALLATPRRRFPR